MRGANIRPFLPCPPNPDRLSQEPDLSSIRPCPLPDVSLLGRYRLQEGAYTDCYSTDLDKTVSQAAFVEAFYTTWVFKLERSILKWAVAKPSTDAQAKKLAQGDLDAFSAWTVEDRCDDQLLLCDMHGRTRSWLMAVPLTGSSGSGTRLYFGSAVVPPKGPGADGNNIGAGFRLLLGFHKLYSEILLRAAKNQLQAGAV
ncbi:hypothetical protein [Pseudoxanthomonas sp. CF125]|uniref:hypothetical protein n=1 Tax=Pseudoxanthomonas sp. CF125 TaxID=1855303 RepID=UPI0008900AC8|nr:hypothetical protein [Pseudoxanthomonas sp. CF125]SDQ34561.1 hypothetical protein SAMN05216569_0751 [Pseudoxanthomonas sp. CF125]